METKDNTKTDKDDLTILETKILKIIYKQNISISLLESRFKSLSGNATRNILNNLCSEFYIKCDRTSGIPILSLDLKGESYIINNKMENRLKLKSGIIGWLIGIATTFFAQFIGNLILRLM